MEENNLLEYNLAAHIHPVFRGANGGYGQGGETFSASVDLIIPADTSAAGFYALNAMNSFVGNAVSGGWCGFAFPNAPGPMGDYKNTLTPTSLWNPFKRPLKRFIGNSAHSTGYHVSTTTQQAIQPANKERRRDRGPRNACTARRADRKQITRRS